MKRVICDPQTSPSEILQIWQEYSGPRVQDDTPARTFGVGLDITRADLIDLLELAPIEEEPVRKLDDATMEKIARRMADNGSLITARWNALREAYWYVVTMKMGDGEETNE